MTPRTGRLYRAWGKVVSGGEFSHRLPPERSQVTRDSGTEVGNSGVHFFNQAPARLDDKNRIAIPSRFRSQLGPDPAYFTLSPDPCIAVYSKTTYEPKAVRVQDLGDDEQGRKAFRRFFSNTAELMPDAQGRVSIPASHINHAGLTKDRELIVAGAGDYFEIWDAEAYREFNKEEG